MLLFWFLGWHKFTARNTRVARSMAVAAATMIAGSSLNFVRLPKERSNAVRAKDAVIIAVRLDMYRFRAFVIVCVGVCPFIL